MLFYWTVALTSLAECYVSVKRIEEFLMMPEYKIPIDPKINYAFSPEFLGKMTIAKMPLQKMVCVNEKSRTPCVIFKNVIAQWNPGSLAGIRNVSFVVKTNQLIGINGPVAAGKSSILLTILRELEIDSGELTINGKYCRIITVKIDTNKILLTKCCSSPKQVLLVIHLKNHGFLMQQFGKIFSLQSHTTKIDTKMSFACVVLNMIFDHCQPAI